MTGTFAMNLWVLAVGLGEEFVICPFSWGGLNSMTLLDKILKTDLFDDLFAFLFPPALSNG